LHFEVLSCSKLCTKLECIRCKIRVNQADRAVWRSSTTASQNCLLSEALAVENTCSELGTELEYRSKSAFVNDSIPKLPAPARDCCLDTPGLLRVSSKLGTELVHTLLLTTGEMSPNSSCLWRAVRASSTLVSKLACKIGTNLRRDVSTLELSFEGCESI
jgi:hypothetical protein